MDGYIPHQNFDWTTKAGIMIVTNFFPMLTRLGLDLDAAIRPLKSELPARIGWSG